MSPPRTDRAQTTDHEIAPPRPPRTEAPRPYQPREAVADATRILAGRDHVREAQGMLDVLRHLSPQNVPAFVRGLSDRQLGEWNSAMTTSLAARANSGSDRLYLANRLLPGVDTATVRRLETTMSVLSPANNTDEFLRTKIPLPDNAYLPGMRFRPIHLDRDGNPDPDRLFGTHRRPHEASWGEVGQGALADCYLAASLAAVARANPGIIERNLRDNHNGTYTVTLYPDGRPTPVTVTGTVPVHTSNGTDVYMHSHATIWAAVYEKAFAQLRGDYGCLGRNGGDARRTLVEITGRAGQAAGMDTTQCSLETIREFLRQGRAVVTTTPGDSKHSEPTYITDENGNTKAILHGWHTYIVTDVSEGPNPTILLVNPWDRYTGTELEERQFQLTEAEWHRYFRRVMTVPAR